MRLRYFKDRINRSEGLVATYGKTPESRGEYDAVIVHDTSPSKYALDGPIAKYTKTQIGAISDFSEVLTELRLRSMFGGGVMPID